MHILLIHQAFATLGEPGGTRHHEMARHFVALGHQVTVLTGQVSYLTGQRTAGGWVQQEVDDVGVAIWRCYTCAAWHRSFVHRLFSFVSFMLSSIVAGLRVKNVNLVWGTSPPIFQALTAWVLARCKQAPFLFEVRDLWPYFAVEVGVLRQPLLIRLSKWLERFLYHRADRVVVNSPGYIEHVRSHGAQAVDLVPNGVDVAMFDREGDGSTFRRANDLEGKYVALYAGAHGMSNDLGVLLEAAERLRDIPELAIVLLGDGKEKPHLMARALELGLSNVRFVPPVPKIYMPDALAAADVCIAILKPIDAYKTTFPNKVFDYMAAGRPVVLAIDGVIREVVDEAGAGVFVKPGDPIALESALRRLIGNRELGARMGSAGHAYVSEHYDRPKLAECMIQVMEQMMGGEPMGDPSNGISGWS